MSRIRVLHILWSAQAGGIAKIVYDLANSQKKNEKLHIEILVCKNEGFYLEKFSEISVACTLLGMKNGTDFSVFKYRKLKRFFSSFAILHMHSFNPIVGWVAKSSGKKIIYTEHGNFRLNRSSTFLEEISSVLQKIFLNSSVDFITFNSDFSKKTSQERFALKKKLPQSVVYNGIPFTDFPSPDPARMDKKILEKIKDSFIVGTSARFVEVKRIDRLIETFAIFCENKNTCLMLCGDGHLRSVYLRQVEKLKIAKQVIFTGFIPDVGNYQASFHVSVIPSQGEAFGLAAVETLSLGIPTIVFSDGGGLTEIIGTLSKVDIVQDQMQLLDRLNYYYNNKVPDQMEKQRRIMHAQTFDIETVQKIFFEIYKLILS